MPIYQYECPVGHVSEAFRPIAQRKKPEPCAACGKDGRLILSRGATYSFKPFTSEMASLHPTHFGSKDAIREHCAREGQVSHLLENGPSYAKVRPRFYDDERYQRPTVPELNVSPRGRDHREHRERARLDVPRPRKGL